MVSSFAVKGDGIQKEQHKVALGLANFKPLAFRIVKSTLRRVFSLLVLSFFRGLRCQKLRGLVHQPILG